MAGQRQGLASSLRNAATQQDAGVSVQGGCSSWYNNRNGAGCLSAVPDIAGAGCAVQQQKTHQLDEQ
jgi:hypothetical protein